MDDFAVTPPWLETTLSSLIEGVVKTDANGQVTYLNTAAESLTGWASKAALGLPFDQILAPLIGTDRCAVLARALITRDVAAMTARTSAADPQLETHGDVSILSRVRFLLDPEGTCHGLLIVLRDVTHEVRTEENLRITESLREQEARAMQIERERALVTLNSIGDAVLSTDFRNHVTYMNRMAETLTGWTAHEALGRPLGEILQILDVSTRLRIENPTSVSIIEDKTIELPASVVLIGRDGVEVPIEDSTAPIHDAQGQIIGAVMVFHDVSATRALSLKMAHLAQHDGLTGLPNRLLLTDRLTQAIAGAAREPAQFAVLYLDLDRFKHVNDSKGHDAGDELLRSVASRLLGCVRKSDTVSRQGGDEFAILLLQINHAQDAVACAENILNALKLPHDVAGMTVSTSASIGIAIYPSDGNDATTLLKNADFAMYQAKTLGRNTYQCFSPQMQKKAVARHQIEAGLREAIGSNAFELHYQPQVHLHSGAIVGVEALLRWRHRSQGLLSPGHFMSVAEEFGLILPIGQWALHEGCRQAVEWQKVGLPQIIMSINISTVELASPGFVENVAAVLRRTGLDPQCLELEITETFLMPSQDGARGVLKELSNLGVKLVLDDFGTGYSSLSFLKIFPVSTIKIDQSFIRDLSSDRDSSSIVRAIISLGKNLNLRVVAEAVENKSQLALLQRYGCLEAQGYYFSKPVTSDLLAALLVEGRPLAALSGPSPI